VVRVLLSILLQDYFLAFRATGIISKYTIIKLCEELAVIFIVLSILNLLYINNVIEFIRFQLPVILVIHFVYAILSPSFWNAINIKNRLKPIPSDSALLTFSLIFSKVSRHVKTVYITGSVCDNKPIRDFDAIFVSKSVISTYILFIYIRLCILKFLLGKLQFFPDFYVHEVCIYSYHCTEYVFQKLKLGIKRN